MTHITINIIHEVRSILKLNSHFRVQSCLQKIYSLWFLTKVGSIEVPTSRISCYVLPKWHLISKVNLFVQVTLVMWPHPIMYRQRDLKVIITCPACLRTSLSNKGHCIWLREPRPRELFPSTVDFWQLTTEVTKGSAHTGLWGEILYDFFTLLFACLFVWTPS